MFRSLQVPVLQNIRENTKFIIYNFTEGEALRKRNDMVKTAMQAKRLKDLIRYAKNYQEQQGYFEEGMQLIYHYGEMNVKNDNVSQNLNDTKRTKRAHPEETSEVRLFKRSFNKKFGSFESVF